MNIDSTAAAAAAPWLLRTARLAFVLMLVVVVASAWLRLAAPRAACVDWPGCRSAFAPAVRAAGGSAASAAAAMSAVPLLAGLRSAHRFAASLLLPTVFALVVLARRARRRGLAARALVMGALALGLAALGIVTPGTRSAAVLLGNFLGGVALLALAWSALCALRAGPALPPGTARWALAGAAVWLLQAAFGVLSGAPAAVRGQLPMPVFHLTLALPALMWGGAVGLAALRAGRRREGAALVVIVLLQTVLGLLTAGSAAAPAWVLVHGVIAAGGVALMLGLAVAPRR
ncbi:MAG: hypothetical protein JSR43_11665 [Proteobacteria bacterium]|nr:hypothetical protein [Pseudomonadota bacterium]HOL37342.1 hypothetical protein [Rubrivivax sp.]